MINMRQDFSLTPQSVCISGAIFTEEQKDSQTELAFKYAVYRINRDKNLLPNHTLIYNIQVSEHYITICFVDTSVNSTHTQFRHTFMTFMTTKICYQYLWISVKLMFKDNYYWTLKANANPEVSQWWSDLRCEGRPSVSTERERAMPSNAISHPIRLLSIKPPNEELRLKHEFQR